MDSKAAAHAHPSQRAPGTGSVRSEYFWAALFVLMASPGPIWGIPIVVLMAWLAWRFIRSTCTDAALPGDIMPVAFDADRIGFLSPAGRALWMISGCSLLGFGAVFLGAVDAMRVIAVLAVPICLIFAYSPSKAELFGRLFLRWKQAIHDLSRRNPAEPALPADASMTMRVVSAAKAVAWLNLGFCIGVLSFTHATGIGAAWYEESQPIVSAYRFGAMGAAVGMPVLLPFLAPYEPARREGVIYFVCLLTILAAFWL